MSASKMPNNLYRLFYKGTILWMAGAVLRMVLDMLQVETMDPASSSWLVPVSGLAATIIGLLYPLITSDINVREPPDLPMVVRCVAVFIGIYQASIKIDFDSYLQLFVTSIALAVGMWWFFDRSQPGFMLSMLITLVASVLTHSLFRFRLMRTIVGSEFIYPRAWSIYFSSCVLFGTIGRWVHQLE